MWRRGRKESGRSESWIERRGDQYVDKNNIIKRKRENRRHE